MVRKASRKLKFNRGRHKNLILLPLQLKIATHLVKLTSRLSRLWAMEALISLSGAIVTSSTLRTSPARCRSQTSLNSGSIPTAQAV